MTTSTRKQLVRDVLDDAKQHLRELGFRKRTGQTFTQDIGSGCIGKVVLSTIYQLPPPEFEIDVPVGVRHQPLERMLAELVEEKFHPYVPATIYIQIGYLMPEKLYRSWTFGSDSKQHIYAVRDLIDCIVQYGVPFMHANRGLEQIRDKLEDQTEPGRLAYSFLDQYEYRLPLTYYMLGDSGRALSYIEGRVAEKASQNNPAADRYRRFAVNLRKRIEGGGSD
ncbi:MAG: hypothetical protein GVY24_07745 [Planctomycetes bacterium]|jgi:hypothetical protein|nr:hypothetical protein [Planctomycetota bacterium]